MKKEAGIIIHQISTAVHPGKKLQQLWREIEEYDEQEKQDLMDELDKLRSEWAVKGENEYSEQLNEWITAVRIGQKPAMPRIVPKQF